MRLLKFLNEFKTIDTDDVGFKGKRFEEVLIKAFDLVGLKYISNDEKTLWDVFLKDKKWNEIINNKNVNIKTFNTKWLFGTSKLGEMLPWDDGIKSEKTKRKYEDEIKKWMKEKKIHDVYYIKTKNEDIEKQIKKFVKKEDVKSLNKIFIDKNFNFYQLGNKFDVEITIRDDKKIGYIKIVKDGKNFMTSESPRKVGGTENFVTFRTPNLSLDDTERNLKRY